LNKSDAPALLAVSISTVIRKVASGNHEFCEFLMPRIPELTEVLLTSTIPDGSKNTSSVVIIIIDQLRDASQSFMELYISRISTSIANWKAFSNFFLPLSKYIEVNPSAKPQILREMMTLLSIPETQIPSKELFYSTVDFSFVFDIIRNCIEDRSAFVGTIFRKDLFTKWIKSDFHCFALLELMISFVDGAPNLVETFMDFLRESPDLLNPINLGTVRFRFWARFVRNSISEMFG
jgi:hypothetical protein